MLSKLRFYGAVTLPHSKITSLILDIFSLPPQRFPLLVIRRRFAWGVKRTEGTLASFPYAVEIKILWSCNSSHPSQKPLCRIAWAEGQFTLKPHVLFNLNNFQLMSETHQKPYVISFLCWFVTGDGADCTGHPDGVFFACLANHTRKCRNRSLVGLAHGDW